MVVRYSTHTKSLLTGGELELVCTSAGSPSVGIVQTAGDSEMSLQKCFWLRVNSRRESTNVGAGLVWLQANPQQRYPNLHARDRQRLHKENVYFIDAYG